MIHYQFDLKSLFKLRWFLFCFLNYLTFEELFHRCIMYESNYYTSIDSQNNRFCEIFEFVLCVNFSKENKLWKIERINIWNLWIKRFLTIVDSTMKRYILIFKQRWKCGAWRRTEDMMMGFSSLEVILSNWRPWRSILGTWGSAPPPSLSRILNIVWLYWI